MPQVEPEKDAGEVLNIEKTEDDDLEWEEWNPNKLSFGHHMIAGSFAGKLPWQQY